jgi:hypothetical protein
MVEDEDDRPEVRLLFAVATLYLPSVAPFLWKFKLHEELVKLLVYILVQVYTT